MAAKKGAAPTAAPEAKSVVKSTTGVELDFSRVMPMTLGDGVALQKLGLMDKGGNIKLAGEDVDLEQQCKLLLHFARKANRDVAMEDIEGLRIEEIGSVMAYFAEASQNDNPDPPT